MFLEGAPAVQIECLLVLLMAQCSSTPAACALGLPASVLGALDVGWGRGARPWLHVLLPFF